MLINESDLRNAESKACALSTLPVVASPGCASVAPGYLLKNTDFRPKSRPTESFLGWKRYRNLYFKSFPPDHCHC